MSGEGAHRTLKQTLAWIADRNLDRVNTAYREWRDRYYEYPQLSDWRSKPPLIWDWRSPVDELDGAAQALRRKCENGALHGTGREGASTPRREIAPLRWPDLMLVDIAGTTAGPQLYDSNAGSLAIMDGRVEPVFHDVLFDVADLLKAFPAAGEMEWNPAPGKTKKPPALSDMISFCSNNTSVYGTAPKMDAALKERFGVRDRDTLRTVRERAGFKGGTRGRPPGSKNKPVKSPRRSK